MRILQVTNFFKPSWESGGPARSCYEISKELVKRGHEITVYTTDGFKYRLNVPKNKPVMVDGIKVYYFRNLSSYLTRKFVLPLPYYLPFIAKKEIKNFDVIHLHEYRTFLNIVVSHYARKYNIPYVLQPRGSFPRFAKTKQKIIFDLLFGNQIIKNAKKIIATSKIEAEQFNISNKKIVFIPNSINLEEFKNLPKKGEFRKKYGIKETEKIILYLGRIHKRKGLDLLVEVFSKLEKNLNIKLVIAGPDDGYLNYLKNLAKSLKVEKKVIFPGPLFEKDKLKAYVDADVFILPSKDKYESFGNVVLEALACGTPVIVTNNCGVGEYLNNEVGCIIECDEKQLSDTILNILTDEKKRIKMSKEAKKIVRNFSWKKVVDRIENLYKLIYLAYYS
ncbi:MAG: LPS biosynthesis protein [Candidatus Aenigmarchaeota archaeon ex4484_56]|nr:MAG: LPS biosynthesis protein [Candidatus Aenigmarchaeota archaeon ex4484_56]